MSWQRIKTIILQTWYHLHHSLETWVDLFFSSAVGMVVMAMIAVYLFEGQGGGGKMIVMGSILWNVLWAVQYSISVGMMWEVWSRSFSSLFITPLTMNEFFVGQAVAGMIKSILVLIVMGAIGWWIGGFSILSLGWWLIVYVGELWLLGIAMAMLVNGLIIRFGKGIQAISWSLVILLQPLGAVYFPLQMLPEKLQVIARVLPLTYVFEAARAGMGFGEVKSNWWMWATGVNGIFLILCYWFLQRMLRWAKNSGAFARMEQ